MSEEKPPKTYLVGYARPPAEHRFAKGQSGNPAGRPRGTKRAGRFAFGLAPTRGLILDEAYRAITLREGTRTITMPTIQAVMRAMAMGALKGNRLAQKNLAEFVQKVERDDFELRMAQFKSAVDYKDSWEAEFKRCDDLGIPRPDPVPHPDDIELDVSNGGVRYHGPMTKADKAKFEAGLDEAAELVRQTRKLERRARRKGEATVSPNLAATRKTLDQLDAFLTPRYRRRVFGDDEG